MRANPGVVIKGRITSDVELRKSESGLSYFRAGVAVNERSEKKGEEKTTFFNVVCFDKMADIYSKLKKGDFVRVEGKLNAEIYTNKDKESSLELSVLADEIMRSDYVGEHK